MEPLGYYAGYYSQTAKLAPSQAVLICLAWIVCPVAVATVLHPSDAISILYWAIGAAVPKYFPPLGLIDGELMAVALFGGVAMLLRCCLLGLYRQTQFAVTLWPVAGVLGAFLDLLSWSQLPFDPVGVLVGLTPLALTVGLEAIFEKMSQDEVFGRNVRPAFQR